MIRHVDLGTSAFGRSRQLVILLQNGLIALGGNRPGKIYGRLDCRAGKRMKPENRLFFQHENEAIQAGYRPCGVCLPAKYKTWKESRK